MTTGEGSALFYFGDAQPHWPYASAKASATRGAPKPCAERGSFAEAMAAREAGADPTPPGRGELTIEVPAFAGMTF